MKHLSLVCACHTVPCFFKPSQGRSAGSPTEHTEQPWSGNMMLWQGPTDDDFKGYGNSEGTAVPVTERGTPVPH